LEIIFFCHSRVGGNPDSDDNPWIPAGVYARRGTGMTNGEN